MSCEYVKKHYGVPAEIGRRVAVANKPGIIAKDCGHYLGVNFDDEKPSIIRNVHPTDKVQYLEMGTVRKPTRAQQRYRQYVECAECYESFSAFLGIKSKP